MHPSPAALAEMSTADLMTYRAEIHELDVNSNDPTGAYAARKHLIDAIIEGRKAPLGACPNGHADPIYVDEFTAECAVCAVRYAV